MIIRKYLNDNGNLCWEFEMEDQGESMDMPLVMLLGVDWIKDTLGKDDVHKVWHDIVTSLSYAIVDKDNSFEKRVEIP